MTGQEFADLCKAQEGQAYVWGGLGYTLTESRISQLRSYYPAVYNDAYVAKCRARIGMEAYDCVGIIKHFLWGNTGDGVLRYYGKNGIPDTTANGLYKLCPEKGDIATMPEIAGLMLHREGHVGVYLGNGKILEARGIDYGVVITNVADRNFEHWGKLPNIEYPEAPAEKTITLAQLSAILAAQGITNITI